MITRAKWNIAARESFLALVTSQTSRDGDRIPELPRPLPIHWILPEITGDYWELLETTGDYWGLLEITWNIAARGSFHALVTSQTSEDRDGIPELLIPIPIQC